jgi:osmoprotectant transport system ATP-binding protein
MKPADIILTQSATANDALIKINLAPSGIIPIVDENGKVIGVVTRGSLLTVFASQWSEEVEGVI